jgi:hypothetical protein
MAHTAADLLIERLNDDVAAGEYGYDPWYFRLGRTQPAGVRRQRPADSGSANPAITISALAARTADWLRRAVPNGELRARPRTVAEVRGS